MVIYYVVRIVYQILLFRIPETHEDVITIAGYMYHYVQLINACFFYIPMKDIEYNGVSYG